MASEGTASNPSPTVRRLAKAHYVGVGFQRAFIDGWYAKLAGRSRDANPYRGRIRKRRGGGVTFTVAWRNAWELGWLARQRRESGVTSRRRP